MRAIVASLVACLVGPLRLAASQEQHSPEPLFEPAEGTSAERWADIQRRVSVVLEASAGLADFVERTKEWTDLSEVTEREFAHVARLFYPSTLPAALEARTHLLAAGKQAFPAVLNALRDEPLNTYASQSRAYYGTSLLQEIVCGHFDFYHVGSALAPEAVARSAKHVRAWRSLWERARGDLAFWVMLTERQDPIALGQAFPRRGSAYILEGVTDLPFIKNCLALLPGTRVRVTTIGGTLEICADEGFGRSYAWEGATRFEVLEPGNSLEPPGLICGGLNDHWEEHNGVTRGVLEEGQKHFNSEEDALRWIGSLQWYPHVLSRDGLVVGWGKNPSRSQLNVDVWQIFIRGQKPSALPDDDDEDLVIEVPR